MTRYSGDKGHTGDKRKRQRKEKQKRAFGQGLFFTTFKDILYRFKN
jgi:hypothetical protein